MKLPCGRFWVDQSGETVLVGDSSGVLLQLRGAAAQRAHSILLAQDWKAVDPRNYNCHAVAQHVVLGAPLRAYVGEHRWERPVVDVPLSVRSVRAAIQTLELPCAVQVSCRDPEGIAPDMAIMHSAVFLGATPDRTALVLHKPGRSLSSIDDLDSLEDDFPDLAPRLRFYGDRKQSCKPNS